MSELQVTCTNKLNGWTTHEHITHIGNNANGWRLTREDAINRIKSGREAYYTLSPTNTKVYIHIVNTPGKVPYLQTYADGKWSDNLLALSKCGDTCKLYSN